MNGFDLNNWIKKRILGNGDLARLDVCNLMLFVAKDLKSLYVVTNECVCVKTIEHLRLLFEEPFLKNKKQSLVCRWMPSCFRSEYPYATKDV